MAKQKVTINRNVVTKTIKVTRIKRTKDNKPNSGRHKTTDCCVHEYHNK